MSEGVSRRAALKMFGAFGATAVVAACGESVSGTGGAGGTGTSTTTTGGTTGTGSASGWATGDGSFLASKDYGNPLSAGPGTTCTVWKDATSGPCHSNTYHRKDATEGLVGLPTRLELLIVDASCNPVPNAIVEIWHCSPTGVYSAAPTVEASDIGYDAAHATDLNNGFCTGGNAAAQVAGWFRAYQQAGADGRVTFDTLYPGWYAGRTVHIHFRVTVGTTQYKTSQLFFEDSLNDEIIADHPTYSARGKKDTTNAADKVVTDSGLALADVVMQHAQQSDGALLAWKVITVT